MELHQIEYFIAVADTGSFSKAAEKCHVTQPSLSQQISKLEQEFDQRLFDRMGRTIAMTQAGKAFLPRARAILSEVHQARHALVRGIDVRKGTLSVGIIPTLAPYMLHGTVRRFTAAYPEAELSVVEDVTDNLVERLVNAEIDVGYMSVPLANRQIVTQELFTERLFLAASAAHPCATLSPLTSALLSGYQFVTLQDRNCLSQQISSFCYVHHIDPQIIYQTYQLATVLEFVRAGLAVAFVPECATRHCRVDDVVFRQLDDATPDRTIVAAGRSGRVVSQLAACFSDCMRQEWLGSTRA